MAADKPISTLLTTGAIHYINYDGMAVVVFTHQAEDVKFEVVGCYRDKKGIIKRIKRDSEIWKTIDHFMKTECGDIPVRGEGGLQKASDSIHVVFTEAKTVFESRKLNITDEDRKHSPFVELQKEG